MKKLFGCFCFALLMSLFGLSSKPIFASTHTPPLIKNSLSLSAEFRPSFQVAGIYWLPDYLKDNTSRDYNTDGDNEDPGGGDVEKTCETYGYASPEETDLSLYDCSDYDIKPVYGLQCYTGCVCKPKFIYTSSNCNTSAGYALSGSSCGGKYESCVCARECCSDSMCGSNETCQNGSCVSLDPCADITCGTNEVCSNGSCVCASGYKSCNGTCISNSSCCTDSDCGTDEACSNGSCTSTCSYTVTADDCSSECKSAGSSSCVRGGTTYYASCGASKCGSDQSCSNGTCVDNCTPLKDESSCSWGTKNCSDNCGGYRSCCKTAAEYCAENGYSSGVTCEKGQTTETCPADSNYKKCSGNGCPASQNCTYGCKTYSSQSGCSDVCTACYDDNCHNRTAVNVPANASCSAYYDDCPSKCSTWACNDGYEKNGNSCTAPTITCANELEGDYAMVSSADELQSTLNRESEVVIMNDIDMKHNDITVTGYLFTPAYFNSSFSQCTAVTTLSTNGNLTINTGGDSFDIHPNLKVGTELHINDNNNSGSVSFYGNVDANGIYGSRTSSLWFYGNLIDIWDSDIEFKEISVGANSTLNIHYEGIASLSKTLSLNDGASVSQYIEGADGKGYWYTVTSVGKTKYTYDSRSGDRLLRLPFDCSAKGTTNNYGTATCKGELTYRCALYDDKNTTVDVSKCKYCDWTKPTKAACSKNCTPNSRGHCNDPDGIISCVDGYANPDEYSSFRTDSTSYETINNHCGTTDNFGYTKIKNCFTGCNDWGYSYNYLAIERYGYKDHQSFYEGGGFYQWCDDVNAGKFDYVDKEFQDVDHFCKCMEECSDDDMSYVPEF